MKNIIILSLIVLSLLACSYIDKESRSLVVWQNDNTKVGLTEKRGGVMLKVVIRF